MEMEKSKVLIQFLLIFRQSGDVLFFLYARRLRGYTATVGLGGGICFLVMVSVHFLSLHTELGTVSSFSSIDTCSQTCSQIASESENYATKSFFFQNISIKEY